jgi:hypothetical protein
LKKDLWKGIRKKEKRKWKRERKERIGEKDSTKTMKGRYKKNDKIMSNDDLYKKRRKRKSKECIF